MSVTAAEMTQRAAAAQLTIVIVNWNTRAHLQACLLALRSASADVQAHVVVVDNDSSDGSADMVRREFPDVELIALPRNVGFAAANNVALERSRSEFVLLLNPDVILSAGALRGMLDFLRARPDAGGTSAVLVGADGRLQASYFRRVPGRMQVLLFYTTLELLTRHVGFLRRRYLEPDLRGAEPVAVDQLPGACCMIRRSVLDDVGLLDPDYFIWFEDVDWCYRMRRAGHRLYALPAHRATHAWGASFVAWSVDRRLWQFTRAFVRFLCKFDLRGLLAWSLGVVRADLMVKEVLVRARGVLHPRARKPVYSVAVIRALRAELDRITGAYRRGELVRFEDNQLPFATGPADGARSAAEAGDAGV